MRNQEIAKGLRLIAEGFTTLASAYEIEPVVTRVNVSTSEDLAVKTLVDVATNKVVALEEVKKDVTNTPVEVVKEEPIKETVVEPIEEEATSETAPITEEELNKLSYNDVKAMAKQLKVKAVGSKKAIIENILASLTPQVEDVQEEEEPIEIEEPVQEDVVDDVEEDTDNVEAEPEDETSLYDQVVLDLEGYSDEELADILSEIGVSPKGRRQALLAKIVQAIEDGKLEWSSEDEESEEEDHQEEVHTNTSTPEVTEEDTESDEFLGTEARKQACYDEMDKIDADLEKGNLSHKEIIKFLKEYNNGRYVSQGHEADINEYIAIQCDLIDDEGTKHELADPYYLGDDIFCCGQCLKEVNDDLYCEICGQEYEK